MAYVRTIALALGAAFLIGAATGATEAFKAALAALPPGEKATVYASGISAAMNCSAFFIVLFVPLSAVAVFIVRRRKRPPAPGAVR